MYKSKIKRPLATGTLFYIIGLIGGELHYHTMQFSLFCVLILAITLGVSLYYDNQRILIYLAFAGIGIISIVNNPQLKIEKIFQEYNGQSILIEGSVLEAREYEYQDQYIIQASSPVVNQKTKIKVTVKKGLGEFKLGDKVMVKGQVEPLSFQRNPGGFNERTYLLIRGITTKLRAESLEILSSQGQAPILQGIRNYYSNMFEQILPWDEAQIMKAMLLGDKTFLSEDIQTIYRDVGIAHVLAISGLHISIIVGVLWWVLKVTPFNKNLQSIIVMVILWTYVALIGYSVSITRSAIMMSIIIGGTLLDEKPDPITSCSFAALILLLYNNLYLWDIGFILSFTAVGSLILITPFLKKIYIIPKKIRDYVAPTLAATLGTIPVIAYYYYVLTPIGILANIILIPLISLVVILGFIAIIFSPISVILAKFIIGSGYYLLKIVEKLSELALKIPYATIVIGRPDLIDLLIYLSLLGLGLWYLSRKLEERKQVSKSLIGMGLVLMITFGIKRIIPQNLTVTFLDVGQGDCSVIITPSRKAFVIDGGKAGSGKIIEQFLKYKGISKVQAAILSHGHADHMDGIGELATTFPIGSLFLSEKPMDDPNFASFYDIIQSEEIPVYVMKGQDFIKNKEITIECLFPLKELMALDGNDTSLVLDLKYGNVSYYFMGDLEENYERQVADHIRNNDINILKVAHHGSKTSSTQELIVKVSPNLAIVSCGQRNIYNHPHQEVVNRYNQNHIPLKMTKDVGAIMTRSNKKTVKIDTMEGKRMLWR